MKYILNFRGKTKSQVSKLLSLAGFPVIMGGGQSGQAIKVFIETTKESLESFIKSAEDYQEAFDITYIRDPKAPPVLTETYSFMENETAIYCIYNVTTTSEDVKLLHTAYSEDWFESMEIDGVVQDGIATTYRFDTIGNHAVKYNLASSHKGVFNPSNCIFTKCEDLKIIVFGGGLEIGGELFFNLNLDYVVFYQTEVPDIWDLGEKFYLYVPDKSLYDYAESTTWKDNISRLSGINGAVIEIDEEGEEGEEGGGSSAGGE